MSKYTNKIDVATKIIELLDNDQINEAMRLQKLFLESIRSDKVKGQYSINIKLDRVSKKVIKSNDIPSQTRPVSAILGLSEFEKEYDCIN